MAGLEPSQAALDRHANLPSEIEIDCTEAYQTNASHSALVREVAGEESPGAEGERRQRMHKVKLLQRCSSLPCCVKARE